MLIGITGTDGAGKGAVVDYLVKEKNFVHYSSRDFIVAEIEDEGLEINRNQMRLTANKMRAKYGKDFVVRQAYKKATAGGHEKIVIESIRALSEAEFLKQQEGLILAVDADQRLRYKRVQARRSASDKVSFEVFVAHEELEKNDPDPNGMQKAKVIEMADYTIMNESTLEELHQKVETILEKIEKNNK